MGQPLKYGINELHYKGIIGTGGIGTGTFFVLNDNQTLGREESRSGHFLNIRDYCKQHIILHYIKVLLGPLFRVIPVGRVGSDDAGAVLYNEMLDTGFVMDHVERMSGVSTLFSFCFYYPDGSGGNLTTDDSASSRIDPLYIEKASGIIRELGSKGIIVAAPEVPLLAREKILEIGKQNGSFCAASFTAEEIKQASKSGLMSNVDLLAVNFDEASALAESKNRIADASSIIINAAEILKKINSKILLSVTAGDKGSWCWDGKTLNFFPAFQAEAVSTAGAGDAFFAGILTGLALGLHFFEAQQLASLIAGLSVTSPDTIHKGIDRSSLKKFLISSNCKISEKVYLLLQE